MATQKQPLTKQLRPTSRIGPDLRAVLLRLKNGHRTKHSQAFPQRGELPTVAGLLLYPDKKEKMVTTTAIAFGPKTCARVEPKKILQCNLILEGDRSFITTHREAFPSQPVDGAALTKRTASVKEKTPKAQTPHFQTNYQKNFSPPQGVFMRRLQVLPCPDNLAVNPALRAEFRTVQMETYPGWNISLHSRLFPAQSKEHASLKEEEVLRPSAPTTRKASSFISPVSV
ncbi:uncharacterized protein si:dkeyp-69c1.9 [Colossoma macropomum]|uniref:uncharacterized protein si:dkeyp-69c1.9 n=1 Tax=Colossoma macropomum TaxID=42526 RepID=UPI0018650712|nr:uncharacterized protein si:dkeyp-69c1.9 [Colossoma macropomum]